MSDVGGIGADGPAPEGRRPGRPTLRSSGARHENPAIESWLKVLNKLVGHWFGTHSKAAEKLYLKPKKMSDVMNGKAYLTRSELHTLLTCCGELTSDAQTQVYRLYMAALREQNEGKHHLYVLEDEHEAAVAHATEVQKRYERLEQAHQETAASLQREQSRTRQLGYARVEAEEDLAQQRLRCEKLKQEVTQARHERDQARAEILRLREELQQAQDNLSRLQEEQQQRLADDDAVAEATETAERAFEQWTTCSNCSQHFNAAEAQGVEYQSAFAPDTEPRLWAACPRCGHIGPV